MESKTIKNREFQCEPFEFDAGWTLLVKLAGLVGHVLPKSLSEAADIRPSEALPQVASAILKAGAVEIIRDVLRGTYWLDSTGDTTKRRNLGEAKWRQEAFGRDYALAAQVLYFALEANYRDSIEAIAAELGRLSPDSPTPRQSPRGQIGEGEQ